MFAISTRIDYDYIRKQITTLQCSAINGVCVNNEKEGEKKSPFIVGVDLGIK